jgi:hypothetical protein
MLKKLKMSMNEPARDLSVLSENLRFFKVFFLGKLPQPIKWFFGLNFPGRTETNGCMILKHLKEPIETCDLLEMQRTAEHWFKHPPTL